MKYFYFFGVIICLLGCNNFQKAGINGTSENILSVRELKLDNEYGVNIKSRFLVPKNFERLEDNSPFATFLRELKLKPEGSQAYYYSGKSKENLGIYAGVLDLKQPEKKLQIHCSDGLFRLRYEYFYHSGQSDKIGVLHANYKLKNFVEYVNGKTDYNNFLVYMAYLFKNLNAKDVLAQLKQVDLKNIQIGDVFFPKGNPNGESVMVVDMAKYKNKKLMLLVQSAFPGQDLQVLQNSENPEISPWFEVKEGTFLTPEFRYDSQDLMRFH